ncbi:MAG: GTPase HflX [Proteobacteria bacterium]|nr:GTPase HflX [Pseudomonadota bacterium]
MILFLKEHVIGDLKSPNNKSQVTPERRLAIIVGVIVTGEDSNIIHEDLIELTALLTTLGVEVAGQIVQKRVKLTPSCLIGTGKVHEIGLLAKEKGATLVVVDRQLSPPQVRNIEEITKCQVLDRAGVILDIFAKHARTNAAKTQVEIARLEHMLPRMVGQWTHLHRQKAGVMGGEGEKQIELDRRKARDRIARLKAQLETLDKERATQRKARRSEIKVALVGYTNSGKTTIMNAMTNGDFVARDALFATLDANVRTIDPFTRPKILMSDTVGFIRNLPHGLIESFKSTLDEVKEADLLLQVVDISHDNYKAQMETTSLVLKEIGAGQIPQLIIFNKIDRVDDPFLAKMLRQAYPGSIAVSAYRPEDVSRLRDHIQDFFSRNFVALKLAVPSSDQEGISLIYRTCMILDADYERHEIVVFSVRVPKASLPKVQPYEYSSSFADTPK